ncbi:hypothetical protein [Lutibacter sp.]|uniref:hypothetical protein n=1 Tax=Lutibacter sp. TaxID=1925666 RepID=UPI003564B2F2
METSKIIPENIHLFHLNILESNIVDAVQKKDNKFRINVAHTTMHNLVDERVKIGLFIDIIDDSEKNEVVSAHFKIEFHYKVEDLKSFYKLDENNEPSFSGLFIATLLGISFSTARGLIYERLSKTNLRGIILPVVSPNKMLSSKVE